MKEIQVGDSVRVNYSPVDFCFFRKTETGVVTKKYDDGRLYNLKVEFDEPMEYEDGFIRTSHNFNQKTLELIQGKRCGRNCHR